MPPYNLQISVLYVLILSLIFFLSSNFYPYQNYFEIFIYRKILLPYFVLSYYIKKVTDFLYAALHGLKFDEAWNGECKTKGFYIFDNGVSLSMYDIKNMLDYIYENAYIEIVDKVAMGESIKYTWQICL